MGRKIQLVIAYDGAGFHGWQIQPGLRTVQGVISEVIGRVARHPVAVIGAGRTDAGVHAAGQVAQFETSTAIPAAKLRLAIGSRLPGDISLLRVREVHADFHATRSAVSKCYRYCVYHSPTRPVSESVAGRCYHFWRPIDLDRLRAAARYFVGTHDFSSMTSKSAARESYVRTVLGLSIHEHFRQVIFDIVGTGFLYHQVRNMVGTLLEVGRGHWTPERIPEILAARDRQHGGPTVPAHGLCLRWVRYPPHLLRPSGQAKQRLDATHGSPPTGPNPCESATSSPA